MYGSFYKNSIFAVYYNYKAVRALRERIKKDLGQANVDVTEAARKLRITRSEWQLLMRNDHDIGKLPFFSVLVIVFGEWLPLIVGFIPTVVPGTARIPKQVRGMRAAAEERRRISFRQGIAEPSDNQLSEAFSPKPGSATGQAGPNGGRPATESDRWRGATADHWQKLLRTLGNDQVHHMSTTLGAHSRVWDRLNVPPPVGYMRWTLSSRLHSLTVDDLLLSENGDVAGLLSDPEVEIACEERGLDVLGKDMNTLRRNLTGWLERQNEDGGRGQAVLTMLFRRSV